ncbi:beta-lactamase-like protein [Pilobolus umbonatus]|nr:beta-lactamase-like protein [Pilobolus umbonatus]
MSPTAPSDKSYKILLRANDHYERHQYQESIIEYTRVLQHSGTDDYLALIYSNRSASYIETKEYKKAEEDAKRVIELDRNWSKGYFRYGEALFRQGLFDEAIESYKQAVEKDPKNGKELSTHITKALIEKDNQAQGIKIIQLVAGKDIAVERNVLSPIQNKIYAFATHMRNIIHIIADIKTKTCIVVDACWDLDSILRYIDEEGYTIVATIITHHHFDHVGGSPPPPYDTLPIKISGLANLLKRLPHIKAYINPNDIPFIQQANPSIQYNRLVPTCTSDITSQMTVGDIHIDFIHTPGHTPGSQSLLVNHSRLLTGDTLLCGGHCGRTDLPGGDRRMMQHTLKSVLGSLDDRIVIYPGHDYGFKWSTIGTERENGCLGEDLVGFGMVVQ